MPHRARPQAYETRFPPDARIIGLGMALVAILYLTISPLALLAFGFAYDDAGGNVFDKIHPATFVAMGVLLLAGIMSGNPLRNLLDAIESYPGTAVFCAMIAVMIAHSIRVVGMPFTFFFDTFIAPVVVFFLFKDMREERARRFVWLIHGLMAVNALIGIGEFATGLRLTPLSANGMVIEDDWRSTALLGHPLSNAGLTGCYILALALGGGRDLPLPLAVAAFILNCAGMVVFGGRASTVLLLIMLMALALLRLYRALRGEPFKTSTIVAVLVAVPLVALALVMLEEAGFFDSFIARFMDDRGSASTRVEMFSLFGHLSLYELLFAPDSAQIATLKRIYGLDFGIESFWVSFVLSYGLIPGLAFFAALFLFCRDLARTTSSGGVWVLVFFFAMASTSVSLSVKTPVFAISVLLLLVLLRRPRAEPRALAPGLRVRPATLLRDRRRLGAALSP